MGPIHKPTFEQAIIAVTPLSDHFTPNLHQDGIRDAELGRMICLGTARTPRRCADFYATQA